VSRKYRPLSDGQATCPSGFGCKSGQCVLSCGTGEFACPAGYKCVNDFCVPQRCAHCNLTPTTLGAGQQQAGHIDCGQQPHGEHQAIQGQQARTDAARQRASVVLNQDSSVPLLPWIAAQVLLLDAGHLASSVLSSAAWAQPANYVEDAARAVLYNLLADVQRSQDEVAATLKTEALGHHPDDCMWRAVQRDGAANDLRIAIQQSTPGLCAQHRDMRSGAAVFRRGKSAPERRLHSQGAQKIGAAG